MPLTAYQSSMPEFIGQFKRNETKSTGSDAGHYKGGKWFWGTGDLPSIEKFFGSSGLFGELQGEEIRTGYSLGTSIIKKISPSSSLFSL